MGKKGSEPGKGGAAVPLLARLAALADILRDPNPGRCLDGLAGVAADVSEATGAVLLLRKETGEDPVIEAAFGLDGLRNRSDALKACRRLAGWAMIGRDVVSVSRASRDERFAGLGMEAESFLSLPLIYSGDVRGALVVLRESEGGFSDEACQALKLVTVWAAVLVHGIRQAEQMRKAEANHRKLRSDLERQESMAALGEMTLGLIADVQKSLATIGGFSRRILRGLPEGDINREYLGVGVSEIERLERMLAEHHDQATASPAQLRMEDLNVIVEEALSGRRPAVSRRKVRIIKRLAQGLPRLLLDAEKVRAALESILDDLLSSIPPGGRLKIESKRNGDRVQLLLAADGPRVPGDVLEKLFVPLAPAPGVSGSPGLLRAAQIIRQHGAEIGLRADQDWPALYSLGFPIKENEDRRKQTDRRTGRMDRRGRKNAA